MWRKGIAQGEKKISFLGANRLGSVCSSCEEQEAAYQQTKISLHLSLELMNFSFFAFFSTLMKQMSNSSHLKHFVSSPKIWAPHPGAVPCWGCPCELGGPWGCGSGGIPGFKAPQQSQQACSRGGWNKGGWNSQFVNLMDPLRLLTAIGVKKDGERWGKKKKRQCIPCLMLLSQGQRGLGTPGTEQRVAADISGLRWRVPLAEWTRDFFDFLIPSSEGY